MTDASREAAAAILGDVATEEVEQPEDTAAEEVQHEAEEDELPEDIQELLAQPDFEDDEDLEPVAEEEIDDYDVDALRRRAVTAEKRAKYVEGLRVADQRKKWVAETERYFKYADVDSIQATSRRGFLKQAETQHLAIKARVDKALEAERAALKTQSETDRAEQKRETAEAWGQPIQGAPTPTSQTDERVQKALRSNRPLEAVKARLSDPNDPVFKALQ